MNITLNRTNYLTDGIFGAMYDEAGSPVCVTVENPKLFIPAGTYVCKRYFSPHFQMIVFQLQNVPDRTHIEIHPANLAAQVIGCIGIGSEIGKLNGSDAILESDKAFEAFMDLQSILAEFTITIIDNQAA